MKFSKFHRIYLRAPTVLSVHSFSSTNCGTIFNGKHFKLSMNGVGDDGEMWGGKQSN